MCPQVINGLVVGTENCLFVNTYRPSFTTSEQACHGLYPPPWWFIDSRRYCSPLLDGNALAAEQDIVVVTFSYHLGALGFLADSSLPDQGNLAMLDQQLALKWVHSNIHFFGGDPPAVTLAGESAVAYGTCLHMIVPESRKLLKAVVMESGGCVGLPLKEGVTQARAFAETVGCKSSNSNSNSSSDGSSGSMIDCLHQFRLIYWCHHQRHLAKTYIITGPPSLPATDSSPPPGAPQLFLFLPPFFRPSPSHPSRL